MIALNKVDRLYDWKETPWGPFQQTLDNQQDYVQEEFYTRWNKVPAEGIIDLDGR